MPVESSALDFYRDKRILVAGGLGFIGSTLAIRLAELGARVRVVDALTPGSGGARENLAGVTDPIECHVATIADPTAAAAWVTDRELVFNLAGSVSHVASMREPLADLDANGRGPLALLEACRLANPSAKVVFASTRQLYGRPTRLPVTEEETPRPTDINGIHKLAAEHYHRLYQRIYGIRTTCLRLSAVYGPRMVITDDRHTFLGWFIRQAIDGDEIQVFGEGDQLRDFVYVDDAVDAFLRAGKSPAADGEVFNVGGAEPISVLELARLLIDAAGGGRFRRAPFPDERLRIDVGSIHVDSTKARRVLGWQPTVPLAAGLARTIHYYRQHPERRG